MWLLFPPFLVLLSSQNLGTLFYWSSWFQHLFFWYIRCQQDLDWCTSCPGKDSSPYQVGRELPPAQSSKKSFPWVSLTINGILTSVYYEVSNIACAAFAEFVDFISKPASLLWYVLNPTPSTQMLRSGVYMEENLDFR